MFNWLKSLFKYTEKKENPHKKLCCFEGKDLFGNDFRLHVDYVKIGPQFIYTIVLRHKKITNGVDMVISLPETWGSAVAFYEECVEALTRDAFKYEALLQKVAKL